MLRQKVIALSILFLSSLLSQTDLANSEALKYDEHWLSLPKVAKDMYLQGYNDGIKQGMRDANTVLNGAITISEENYMKITGMHSPWAVNSISLIRVMDDLYRDPANVNLQYNWIFLLAKDKLEGKPIDEELSRYRKKVNR